MGTLVQYLTHTALLARDLEYLYAWCMVHDVRRHHSCPLLHLVCGITILQESKDAGFANA